MAFSKAVPYLKISKQLQSVESAYKRIFQAFIAA